MTPPKKDTASSGALLDQTLLAQTLETELQQLDHQLNHAENAVTRDDSNSHVWTAFVRILPPPKDVKEVTFQLHPTFSPSIVNIKEEPFEVQRVGWGLFCVVISIHFKQESLEFEHNLDFSKPEVSELYHYNGLEIEIGNTHSLVENASSDEQVKQIKIKRDLRRKILALTKQKYENVQNAGTQLQEFLESIPAERHDMALGAYLAGVYQGNLTMPYLQDLYDFATDNLRYVVLDGEIPWRDFVTNWTSFLNGDPQGLQKAFELSRPLPRTEQIDIFVSHCWSDDGVAKADMLERISRDFEKEYGRRPRFWLDMFCMPQTGKETIAKNVAALPLFMKASNTMAVLLTDALLTRLWCLVEIYTAYILSPRSGQVKFRLCPIQKGILTKLASKKTTIWIEEARCGLQRDQDLLLQNLKDAPGGLRGVENRVNAALKLPYEHHRT